MKRQHIVPLSSQAIVVLKKIFEFAPESEWLIPSRRTWTSSVMSEGTINQIIQRMGYKGKLVGHGFRSMFSTILNDHGFDKNIVDRQLAHIGKDKIEAAYNRAEYSKKRIEMMQWWGDFLDSHRSFGQRFCRKGFEVKGSLARLKICGSTEFHFKKSCN